MPSLDRSHHGTHPATAAIVYALVAFFVSLPVFGAFALAAFDDPGWWTGILVVSLQGLAAALAFAVGWRRHRHGTEW